MTDHANIFDADGVIPPAAPDPWHDNEKLRAALVHWQHEVGKLHSQVDRLRAENAELIAANQALVVREAEARRVMHDLCDDRGDDVLASVRAKWSAAHAWLKGGAK